MLIIISAVSLLLSWVLPLHFPPWVSWHLEVLAFLSAFSFAWAMMFTAKKKALARAVNIPVLSLPFVLLAMLAVGQYAAGLITFGGDALVYVFYMALCVLCLTLGYNLGYSKTCYADNKHADSTSSALRLTATIILAGAFASAVIAFAQVLDIWDSAWISRMPDLRRPGGNLGQPNHLATLLMMGMASLLFLYESGRLKLLSSILLFFVLAAALATTESRTGVLSFLLLAGWWFVKKRRANFKLSSYAVITAVIGFLLFFWIWPPLFLSIHLLNKGAGINVNAGSRLVVWPQLLQAVMEHPWVGWGFGSVSKAHNSVAHAYSHSEPFSYSHNILLDFAVWIGVPLAIILLIVAGIWIWVRAKNVNRLEPWYCLAIALPLIVHSMLEFPFAYAYFLVPAMFLLGLLEGMVGGRVAFRAPLYPSAVILLLLNALTAWSAIEYFKIEEDFRIARFEALRMGKTPSDYIKPKVIGLTQLGALLDGTRIVPKPGMTAEEIKLAREVAMRYPWTGTQNRYALSLALNGNPEEATRQLQVIKAQQGGRTYENIKENWKDLAETKFPQLRSISLP